MLRNLLKSLSSLAERLWPKRPDPPRTPDAGVSAPVRKGPPKRGGSVALAEPNED